MNTRTGVNLFLAVQRQMNIVLVPHDLDLEARSRDALVDDFRGQSRSPNALAALAGVFAANVAVYEEPGGHAIEQLAHVIADAGQRLAALAQRVAQFVVMVDAR